MRIILVALCAVSLYAADLTGRWTGPASTADNGQEFVLALKQAPDGTLTGYIQSPRATDTIVGGKVDGTNLTLDAERPGRNNAVQKVAYTGVVEGDKLKLTLAGVRRPGPGGRPRVPGPRRAPGSTPPAGMQPPPNRPPQVVELARVSTEAPTALAAASRTRLPAHARSRWRPTVWRKRRRWAGTVGTSSATRSATRWSARSPTPWSRAA